MRVRVGRSETESVARCLRCHRCRALSRSIQYYDIKLLINNLINKPQPIFLYINFRIYFDL